ncbi:MAG: radical SAM protein [Phycisphaerae bacterium]
MRVFEIFRSIQGETTRVGLPMAFVRVAGCDLACSYCDTPDARPTDAGRDMTVAEVLARLDETGLPWCMITGGEPLLQAEDVNALVVELVRRGREVMVETSGAHPIDLVDARARRIVDIKTPGSGMADRMDWRNLERLTPRDEVKFVLTGRPDYDWAKEVVESHGLLARCPVLFGAARPLLDPKALAGWLIEDPGASRRAGIRLNLQIHKMLGLP